MVETKFLVDILTVFSSEVPFSRIRKIQVSQINVGIDEEFNTRTTDEAISTRNSLNDWFLIFYQNQSRWLVFKKYVIIEYFLFLFIYYFTFLQRNSVWIHSFIHSFKIMLWIHMCHHQSASVVNTQVALVSPLNWEYTFSLYWNQFSNCSLSWLNDYLESEKKNPRLRFSFWLNVNVRLILLYIQISNFRWI